MAVHFVVSGSTAAAASAVAIASSCRTASPTKVCSVNSHRLGISVSSGKSNTNGTAFASSSRRSAAVAPQQSSAGARSNRLNGSSSSSHCCSVATRIRSSQCESTVEETTDHARSCSTAVSRRSLLLSSTAAAVATAAALEAALTAAGAPAASAAEVAGTATDGKTRKLPIDELKNIIAGDIGERQYFVTGNLTKSIYRDDCRFQDPTNTTVGLDRYLAAVNILFDPAYSSFELLSIKVAEPNVVEAQWRLGGYLKFPWRPRVVPFNGSTRYVFDDEGLVELHDEAWGISPFTALLETFTPTFGPQKLL